MRYRGFVTLVAMGLVVAACGGDDGGASPSTPALPTPTPSLTSPVPTVLEDVSPSDLYGLAVDSEGGVYFPDGYPVVIYRFDPEAGTFEIVAGNGSLGSSGDGGAAFEAEISVPNGLTIGPNGNLYFAEPEFGKIRMVDLENGVIFTFAGTDRDGYNGDHIPATSARLSGPHGLTVDADGNLFIADSINYRIRRVDAETGEITTVVGTGRDGYSGDGGPAREARIGVTRRPAIGPDRRLYIDDCANRRVRAVDLDTGIIETVVGTGGSGLPGDDIPAVEASIGCVDAIAFDPDGLIRTLAS